MRGLNARQVALLLATLLLSQVANPGAETPESLVATTPHFVFHNDLDTNLNDALIVAGTARNKGESELFHEGAEKSCFDGLAPEASAGWNLAVDFYAEVVSPVAWNKREQILLRHDLAGLERRDDPRARSYVGIARGFLAAAAPAYRECRWEAQDAENRGWLHDLLPRLKAHGEAIGRQLEIYYRKEWHGLPMRVDVVSTAPSKGANTWILDPGGHILISTAVDRGQALEIVFHEASHTLVAPWRPDPVPKAIEDAAKELDMKPPRDLWHVVLFYTTGNTVRRVLEEAGEPGYVPYIDANNLWTGSWGRYRDAIEATWPAYMAGESELPRSALELVKSLAGQKDKGQ